MSYIAALKLFLLTLVSFLVLDFTWLGFIAKNMYSQYLGHLMATNVQWSAAIIFYILFTIALIFFAIWPGIQSGSLLKTMLIGAFFGAITYATYDLTNLATLKDWPLLITVIDILWGSLLSASVSGIVFSIWTRFFT